MEDVYQPAEDSYFLAEHVACLVFGDVLDMGTGSGIQAVEAARKPEVRYVLAVDINPSALKAAEKRAACEGVRDKITFTLSDLFVNVKGVYDWIIFNPPYLPGEGSADEVSWVGGDTGGEIIKRFLRDAKRFLRNDGSVLMVYSDRSGLSDTNFSGYNVEKLGELPLFFETLTCVRLSLS
ncbi:methyltransferase [Candidatus Bathyarchaeota archaeon]|nr:methyltransferase [Candidatus Bathyarchaeota archaeon]